MRKTKRDLEIELKVLKEGLRSINHSLSRLDQWEKLEIEKDLAVEKSIKSAHLLVDKYQVSEDESSEFANFLDEFILELHDGVLVDRNIEIFYLGFKAFKSNEKLK